MKITLISLIEGVNTPSLRSLSAELKAQGYAVEMILLPWNHTDHTLDWSNSFRHPYPVSVLEQIGELCRSSDLVGISLMTCHFDNAILITNSLRRTGSAPIIWGGMHPTLRPEECLKYADMVCIGEGEISLSQLVREMAGGKSWQSVKVPGIWKQSDGNIPPGTHSPIVEDLDRIPLPDYDLEHQYVLYEEKLIRFDARMLSRSLGYTYPAMFSRGCPYACTYCCNNALQSLYGRKLPVRWRSVDKWIEELQFAIRLMPDLRGVSFGDDAFLAQPQDVIEEFSAKYKELIGLPFSALSTPRSISEPKMSALADAGMYHIAIGIQSGSERIFKGLYHRPESLSQIVEASACIKAVTRKQKKQILGRYDFILDNPWETDADVEASIRLCSKLAKPFSLATFTLTFYPGTDLYQKARADGLVTDDLNQIYRASQLIPKRTYLNGVFMVQSANAPGWLISFLLWKPTRRWFPCGIPYGVAFVFDAIKFTKGFFGFIFKGQWTAAHLLLKPGVQRLFSVFKSSGPEKEKAIFCGGPGQYGNGATSS